MTLWDAACVRWAGFVKGTGLESPVRETGGSCSPVMSYEAGKRGMQEKTGMEITQETRKGRRRELWELTGKGGQRIWLLVGDKSSDDLKYRV